MMAEKIIKDYLNQNGIKLIYLSKMTGINESYLSRSLNGYRNLKGWQLICICNVLNLELQDFKVEQQKTTA